MVRTQVAVSLLAMVALLAGCGGDADDNRSRQEGRFFGAGIDGYLPGDSLQDWVDYAVQVSVVTVLSEEQLTPQPTPEGSDQPPWVGRLVTLRIEETIWRAEAETYPTAEVTIGTWGWTLDDGELITMGRGRYEVGRSYLVPFMRMQDGWAPLVLSAIPVSNGSVEVGFPAARRGYAQLDGLGVQDVAQRLAALKPDPLLARLVDVPAEDRWESIWEAQRQATATAEAWRTPSP